MLVEDARKREADTQLLNWCNLNELGVFDVIKMFQKTFNFLSLFLRIIVNLIVLRNYY